MNMGCYSLLLLNWFFQTKKIICGTIYKHPGIKISSFNNEYLIPLPAIILQEERTCLLIGDFNVEQDTDHNISDFYDILSSNFFAPYILEPTRWAKKSKSLIDNLFQNPIKFNTFSGNLTLQILDHLPQFLINSNTLISSNNVVEIITGFSMMMNLKMT